MMKSFYDIEENSEPYVMHETENKIDIHVQLYIHVYEKYLLLSQIKKKVLLGFFFKGKIKLIFQDLIFDIL